MKTALLTKDVIRVHRNEQDIGYFTTAQARAALANGVLRSDDWAFHEGVTDWRFLSAMLATLPVPPTLITAPVAAARRPTSPHPWDILAVLSFLCGLSLSLHYWLAFEPALPSTSALDWGESRTVNLQLLHYADNGVRLGVAFILLSGFFFVSARIDGKKPR